MFRASLVDESLFEARTPLRFRFRLPRKRWKIIISDVHDQRRRDDMDPVRVFYDHDGNTLTVWFEPKRRARKSY